MERLKKGLPFVGSVLGPVAALAAIGFLLVRYAGSSTWLPAVTPLVAAAVLAVAGVIAYRQLQTIRAGQRATILTSLDQCWMNSEMAEGRSAFLAFQNEVEKITTSGQRAEFIRERLWANRGADEKSYKILTRTIEFFEGVGYYVQMNYILKQDAEELYGPAVRASYTILRGHIADLQEKLQDKKVYNNFLWLGQELTKQS